MKSVLTLAEDSVVLHSDDSEMHFSSSIKEEHSFLNLSNHDFEHKEN